jgi:hypothetical protein
MPSDSFAEVFSSSTSPAAIRQIRNRSSQSAAVPGTGTGRRAFTRMEQRRRRYAAVP